jgi:nicotinamidase/pyrazinamidase
MSEESLQPVESGVIPSIKAGGRSRRAASQAENRVLLAVDLQNDFCPDGALAVPEGDLVIPIINELAKRFKHVVVTQDWHCPDHLSFASSHPGRKPLDRTELSYGEQILWPDHCVQGTRGAEFHPDLNIPHCELILRKGYHREIDSYSAFFENDRRTPTGLCGCLRERGLTRLFIAGLATDFCVAYSALDARKLGFEVTVIESACRGIDVAGSLEAAWKQMLEAGVMRA